MIDVSYVGAEGHHIYREVDGNPPDPALGGAVAHDLQQPDEPQETTGCTTDDVIKTNLYLGKEFGVLPFDAVAHNALVQPFDPSIGGQFDLQLAAS